MCQKKVAVYTPEITAHICVLTNWWASVMCSCYQSISINCICSSHRQSWMIGSDWKVAVKEKGTNSDMSFIPRVKVRMDALGLVCESHRSTEALTSEEMELLRLFLPPNLNSQSPGVRQQMVSLLKKVSIVPCVVLKVSVCLRMMLKSTLFTNAAWNVVVCSCCAEWRTAQCCCRRDWSRSEWKRTSTHSTCTRWSGTPKQRSNPGTMSFENGCELSCVFLWCRSSSTGSVWHCWRFCFLALPSQNASCPFSCCVCWARPSLLAQVHRVIWLLISSSHDQVILSFIFNHFFTFGIWRDIV